MKYLIHSTYKLPAHIADVTGRAICCLGPAAWKRTQARSGLPEGVWSLVDGDTVSAASDIAAINPARICGSCRKKQRGVQAWLSGGKKPRRRMGA